MPKKTSYIIQIVGGAVFAGGLVLTLKHWEITTMLLVGLALFAGGYFGRTKGWI